MKFKQTRKAIAYDENKKFYTYAETAYILNIKNTYIKDYVYMARLTRYGCPDRINCLILNDKKLNYMYKTMQVITYLEKLYNKNTNKKRLKLVADEEKDNSKLYYKLVQTYPILKEVNAEILNRKKLIKAEKNLISSTLEHTTKNEKKEKEEKNQLMQAASTNVRNDKLTMRNKYDQKCKATKLNYIKEFISCKEDAEKYKKLINCKNINKMTYAQISSLINEANGIE